MLLMSGSTFINSKQQELGSCKQVLKHLIYFIKVLQKFYKSLCPTGRVWISKTVDSENF